MSNRSLQSRNGFRGEGDGGTEGDRTEKAVWKGPLNAGLRKGRVVCILSFISPGTPSKNYTREEGADRRGGSNSHLLDSPNAPFRRIRDPSFFFPSGMKKRVGVGEG